MLSDGGDPELAARLQLVARHTLKQMGAQLQGLEGESFTRTEEELERRLGTERLQALAAEYEDAPLESVLTVALALLAGEPVASTPT
jgi:hypothetical protein